MDTLQPCIENDALLVDDLLDFSCGDIGGLCEDVDDCVASVCGQQNDSSCVQAPSTASILARPPSSCAQEGSESLYSPPEELAGELEWLSTFMEDSYKGADQSIPLASSEQWFRKSSSVGRDGCLLASESPTWARPSTTSWLRMSKSGTFCQFLDVGSSPLIELSPTDSTKNYGWDKRGRSKRSSRSGGRVWSLQTVMAPKRSTAGYHSEGEEEEEEHSQVSSLDYESFSYYEAERQPPRKKPKKERSAANEAEGRRCSHCHVQKTPQWRAGPLGPKTLCNACGVRYKSGRLLPEYRPAASPTFITELHSNSHKKVLEMRVTKLHIPHPHQQPQHQDQEEMSTCSQESMSSEVLQ